MIQALALWVNVSLRIRRVKFEAEFDETKFTTINMTKMVDEGYVHYLNCKTKSYVITTGKFLYNKWEILEETVINWLQAKIGFTNLPLSYVISKDTNPLTMDHSELIIYNDSLTTAVLKSDKRKVANMLTRIVLDNDAFIWGGRHRRVLPVLRYPRNMVIYHFPLIGVIFMVILLIFIIQNYPNFFSKYYPKSTIRLIYPFIFNLGKF